MTDEAVRQPSPTDRRVISTAPFADLVGQEIIDLVLQIAPTKVSSRVGKALDHYTKALRLVGVDDEMGAIRCIAAEEELVVAIFEWLKLNSDKVPEHKDFIGKYKNHRVKLAFYPVLSQLRFAIGAMPESGITFDGFEEHIHWSVTAIRQDAQVKLQIRDETGKDLIRINTLDVGISQGDRSNEEVIGTLFNDLVNNIADQREMTLREFVSHRADYRNRLLYAEDGGFVLMAEDLDSLIRHVFSSSLRDPALVPCGRTERQAVEPSLGTDQRRGLLPRARCGRPGHGLSRRPCATNALTKGGAMLCRR